MISKLAKTYLGATIPVVNVYGAIGPQLYPPPHAGPSM
jgi:hypothetical protein